MKYITYSLFKYNKIYNDRWWDPYKNKLDRYYYNIPLILIFNDIHFSSFITKFYIDENINPIILEFLYKITQITKNFVLETKSNSDINEMFPTLWRYEYINDRNISILYPRDIDNIYNKEELYCYDYFENSNISNNIMTIKSKKEHSHDCCKMLAGLSGFKPINIKIMHFDSYYNSSKISWGTDQEFLIKLFLNSKNNNISNNILEFHINEFLPNTFAENDSNLIINNEAKYILNKINKFKLCEWAGQPCDSRIIIKGVIQKLKKKNKFCYDINNIILSNNELKKFYYESSNMLFN